MGARDFWTEEHDVAGIGGGFGFNFGYNAFQNIGGFGGGYGFPSVGQSYGGGFNFGYNFGASFQGNLQLGNGWSQYIGPSSPWDRPGWPQVPQVGPMPTVFTWHNVNGTGGTNVFFPGFGAHIV